MRGIYRTSYVDFTRLANTTAYTALDAVGPATVAITGTSNTTPIVVTATAHGLTTGDCVTIAGITGNTGANGNWVVTVLTANTYSLDGSVGNGSHGGSPTIAKLLKFADFFLPDYPVMYVVKARLMTDQAANVARYRLALFNVQVTAEVDNVPHIKAWANRVGRQGEINFPAAATDGTGSAAASSILIPGSSGGNVPLLVTKGATTALFGKLLALDGFTPASAQNYFIELDGEISE